MGALAEEIEDKFAEIGIEPKSKDGRPETGWILVDGGDVISVIDTSMIFAQKTINKTTLLYFLIADLMVPVIMVFGTPNQRSAEAILFTLERRSA